MGVHLRELSTALANPLLVPSYSVRSGMDQARLDRAMNRIDAALARIDAIATQAAPSNRALGPGVPGSDERLRNRVQAALSELDKIIAEVEQ